MKTPKWWQLAEAQPDWLKQTLKGLSERIYYSVFLEGDRFAIVKCAGHTSYLNRASGNKYQPARYALVEKGVNYWHSTYTDVATGRLNEGVRTKCQARLIWAEGGGIDRMKAEQWHKDTQRWKKEQAERDGMNARKTVLRETMELLATGKLSAEEMVTLAKRALEVVGAA